MQNNYVVITPAKNESKYITSTINSMIKQTIKPQQWIIVDDGSSDNMCEIIEKIALQNKWITVIKNYSSAKRAPGANVVNAFNYGLSKINSDYDYIVKLDADLEFEGNYFEKLLKQFEINDRLGIAGGYCVNSLKGNKLKMDNTPEHHVRGATKMYRKKCLDEIGGLLTRFGWDAIDEMKAMMLGWETKSFRELIVLHLRPTGIETGLLRYAWRRGTLNYYMGYNPVYVFLSCINNFGKKPYIIFGLALLTGYIYSFLTNGEQIEDKNFILFIKEFQSQRIKFYHLL
jgi:poly-beta-1,6-N-acetyl-D-glucosamine synthase